MSVLRTPLKLTLSNASRPVDFYFDEDSEYSSTAYLSFSPENPYQFLVDVYHQNSDKVEISSHGCIVTSRLIDLENDPIEEGPCLRISGTIVKEMSSDGGHLEVRVRGVTHKMTWALCPNLNVSDFQGVLYEDIDDELVLVAGDEASHTVISKAIESMNAVERATEKNKKQELFDEIKNALPQNDTMQGVLEMIRRIQKK